MRPSVKKVFDYVFRRKKTYIINDSLSTNTFYPRFSNEELPNEGCPIIPRRYIVVLLGFLSFAVLNAQRVNMVIALAAMTNSSIPGTTQGIPQACPSTTRHNSTEYIVVLLIWKFIAFLVNVILAEVDVFLDALKEYKYVLKEQICTLQNDDYQLKNRGMFNWNSEVQSYIVGSSFFGFVLTQILGGRLSETLGAKQILIFSVSSASLCNLVSPLAATWNTYLLIAAQFLKGMSQGFIQPAVSCLMVRWYPSVERGFLSSLTYSGFPVGALFGGITSGALCDTNFLGGWPSVFYVFGFFGIVLVLLLQFCAYNSPEEDKMIKNSELKHIICNQEIGIYKKDSKIPWLKMAFSAPTWALLAGMFGQYWMTLYFISVHPSYLTNILNFKVAQSGIFSSLPYILQVLIIWFASYISDWIARKKYASTDFVRKACNTLSCFGFSLSLLGVVYAGCSLRLNTICFIIAMGCIGFGFPGSLTVPMDMTMEFTGTLMGISSTFASTCGFMIPVVVGQLTNEQQTMGQWRKVFVLSAAIVMSSGVIFHLFGSATLQNWEVCDQRDETEQEKETQRDEIPVIASKVEDTAFHNSLDS